MTTKGILYVIATPLGNLSDFAPRAIETLNKVDLILCEDTRHFLKLATAFNIKTRTSSYHDHNERSSAEEYFKLLESGKNLALVSDAGTPTISDPGYRIVRICRQKEIVVLTIPGPSSITAALSISGLPTDNFYFTGFIPQKSGQRITKIQELLNQNLTTVFLESPHRILKTCEILAELAPTREIFIVREMTKIFEEGIFGSSLEVFNKLVSHKNLKGEFVGVISKQDE